MSELDQTPNQTVVAKISNSTKILVERLREDMFTMLTKFERDLQNIFDSELAESWRTSFQHGKEAYSLLRTQLSEQGTDPDKYLQYQKRVHGA